MSQCYHSLYTHGISWALHGKRFAKANINDDSLLGNRLDRAVRSSSDGQTIGIPVGPDTSLVVAEIVLSAVDDLVQERLAYVEGVRYLDDYDLVFRTRAEADAALVVLENALAEFELMVNPAKTRVLELPQPFGDEWAYELRAFEVRDTSPRVMVNDLLTLFNAATRAAQRRPGALKYALRKLRNLDVARGAWPTFQRVVWAAVAAEPTTLPVALGLLLGVQDEYDLRIDADLAGGTLEALISRHAPLSNSSEVVWALWAALALEIELSGEAANAVSGIGDDFVAITALHAEDYGLMPEGSLDTTLWEACISEPTALTGDHWLLAYEAQQRNWLATATNALAPDPLFGQLGQSRVRFFDEEAVLDPFAGPAGPLPGGLLMDFYG